ncbi:hypothetical protein GJV06_01695 [Enterobacteriaceae bacterium RIT691]|nr:hypothetical protein [Enterobacteriaceae bacterium RIT691]
MKWIFLLMLSITSFFAQAGNCEKVKGSPQTEVYYLNPSQYNGSINLSDLKAEGNAVQCSSIQNVALFVTAGKMPESVYFFRLGSKFYSITFSSSLNEEKSIRAEKNINLSTLLTAALGQIDYRIQEVPALGGDEITPGTPFIVRSDMNIKEYNTSSGRSDNQTLQYEVRIKLQLKIMTCGFDDQIVNTGTWQLNDVLHDTTEFVPRDIQFTCKNEGSGDLSISTGDVQYYFDDTFGLVPERSLLQNFDEKNVGGAGEVGFEIHTASGTPLRFGRDQLYTLKDAREGVLPVSFLIRARAYGKAVTSGTIESKTKVVVVYN